MKKKDMDLLPSMEQTEKQNLWNCQRWEGNEKDNITMESQIMLSIGDWDQIEPYFSVPDHS
jgi:hypothetical protein